MSSRSTAILTVLLISVIWQLPYGPLLMHPLKLCATYVHEMGHGVAAMMIGGKFNSLALYADGSGLASWQGRPDRLGTAFVAASGLLGPTLAGSWLLIVSSRPSLARHAMAVIGLVMAASAAALIRNPFGVAFVFAMAAAFFTGAKFLKDTAAAHALRFIAIALSLSFLGDLNYMFSSGATVDGVLHHSDTATIANALFLPYWFWGGVIAAVSISFFLAIFKTPYDLALKLQQKKD